GDGFPADETAADGGWWSRRRAFGAAGRLRRWRRWWRSGDRADADARRADADRRRADRDAWRHRVARADGDGHAAGAALDAGRVRARPAALRHRGARRRESAV